MKTRVQKWWVTALRCVSQNRLRRRPASTLMQPSSCLSWRDRSWSRRIIQQPLSLDQLLLGVTDDNMPGDWDTGPASRQGTLVSRKSALYSGTRRCGLDYARSASRP